MLLQHLLEARRNPELNPRVKAELYKYLEGHYYVTFTDLPKVGVHPTKAWTTPYGIYAYPLFSKQSEHWVQYKMFPFAGERKYATVLANKGNELLLSDVTQEHIDRLETIYMDEFGDQDAWTIAVEYPHYNLKGTIAHLFWNMSNFVAAARYLGPRENQTPREYLTSVFENNRHMVVKWNTLLREMGWDVITDDVGKVIHMLETYQTLFLNPQAIVVVDRMSNPNRPQNKQIKTPFYLKHFIDATGSNPWYMFRNAINLGVTHYNGDKYTVALTPDNATLLGKLCSDKPFVEMHEGLVDLRIDGRSEREFFRAFVINAVAEDMRRELAKDLRTTPEEARYLCGVEDTSSTTLQRPS